MSAYQLAIGAAVIVAACWFPLLVSGDDSSGRDFAFKIGLGGSAMAVGFVVAMLVVDALFSRMTRGIGRKRS